MCSANINFHDKIAQMCFELFKTLPKCGKPKENEWTILSCIVLEHEGTFKVVALGTGTKCIGHDKMSEDGGILNDSHAEVICRRAFLRYIYENMLQQKNYIFQFNLEKQKFIIKDNVKFHFFSTHVPCGDAAIFAKQDIEDFGESITRTKNNSGLNLLKRTNNMVDVENKKIKLEENGDIFRTGAKCLETDVNPDLQLEGANFHVTGVVRTKPGRGVRTLSVACSDKLAKWCHLGIQGALLGILLNTPIYFNSFTISGGTPYNEEAMKRALFNRLGNVHLQPPYEKRELVLGQANLIFSYRKLDERSTCPSSIVWLNVENIERQIEVAVDGRRQGVTKKQLKTVGALKICKMALFKKFLQVIELFKIKLVDDENLNQLTYKQAKMYSRDYQKSWSVLKKNFKVWTVKDDKLMEFCSQRS